MVAAWQILEAGVNGAKSLEDKQIAAWLKKNVVTTVYGRPCASTACTITANAAQLIRQVQDKQWKVVWPKQFVAPGVKLIAYVIASILLPVLTRRVGRCPRSGRRGHGLQYGRS